MEELRCKVCGGILKRTGDIWECTYCGNTYEDEKVQFDAQAMRDVLDEVKNEKVANLRKTLYDKVTAKYIDSQEVLRLAKEIKGYLPDDFFATFCEIANSAPIKEVNEFLDGIDVKRHADYINIILTFMIKSLKSENLLSLNNLIERAYKDTDLERFDKMTNKLAEEAKKVDAGVYELNMPRDVFVIYSSKDMDVVTDLVTELENQGLKCFVAMRNLQHGRGAVQNYQHALETAIDNSKVVVFISSGNSRNLSCDAIRHELPYIKRKDFERIPPQYRSITYEKLPSKFKKPRVEFRINRGTGSTAADDIVKEFFAGQEYCYTPETVSKRVADYITGMSSVLNADDVSAKEIVREKTVYVGDSEGGSIKIDNYLKRVVMFLRDGNFGDAAEYCEKVLDVDPENCDAYIYKLMCELHYTDKESFVNCEVDLNTNSNFRHAVEFADSAQKKELLGYHAKNQKYIATKSCNEEAERAKRKNDTAAENAISACKSEYEKKRNYQNIEIENKKSEIKRMTMAIGNANENKVTLGTQYSWKKDRIKAANSQKTTGVVLSFIGLAIIIFYIIIVIIGTTGVLNDETGNMPGWVNTSFMVGGFLVIPSILAIGGGAAKIKNAKKEKKQTENEIKDIQAKIEQEANSIEQDKNHMSRLEDELKVLQEKYYSKSAQDDLNAKIKSINATRDEKNAKVDEETAMRIAEIERETEEKLAALNE